MCPCFIVSGFIKLNYQRVASAHSPPRIAWITMGAKDWKLLHAYSEDWPGCAYWSVFTGRPYRKIHCLFVFFFITDNKWAAFISYDMRWSGFATSQNTSYPRHPTSQYTVDLSLPVTWIERSIFRNSLFKHRYQADLEALPHPGRGWWKTHGYSKDIQANMQHFISRKGSFAPR